MVVIESVIFRSHLEKTMNTLISKHFSEHSDKLSINKINYLSNNTLFENTLHISCFASLVLNRVWCPSS